MDQQLFERVSESINLGLTYGVRSPKRIEPLHSYWNNFIATVLSSNINCPQLISEGVGLSNKEKTIFLKGFGNKTVDGYFNLGYGKGEIITEFKSVVTTLSKNISTFIEDLVGQSNLIKDNGYVYIRIHEMPLYIPNCNENYIVQNFESTFPLINKVNNGLMTSVKDTNYPNIIYTSLYEYGIINFQTFINKPVSEYLKYIQNKIPYLIPQEDVFPHLENKIHENLIINNEENFKKKILKTLKN